MIQGDLPQVLAIEHSLFPDPWSEGMFREELKDDGRRLSVCLRSGNKVIGYAVGWFVADEFHLGNIAVVRQCQRKGFGRQLVEYVLDQAQSKKCSIATLEVRTSNATAIALYRHLGFKEIALRKKYYRTEDAVVMLAELSGSAPC
ncbi:MAG: ribosomal protein S18-alanine N-acetyltransferase [Candidatus Edwardsbacteria bacterium]|nr:ribosomal protein S18-alanine N-acetyltransferase [Candidatus Edwardsbacteria bacterium]